MQQPKPLLDSEDVARRLNVEVITVRRLVKRGQLAAYRVGGEFRFSEEDVQTYLAKQYLPVRSGLVGPLRINKKTIGRESGIVPTKRAKQALRHAVREVVKQNQAYMGTEHVLLGLITTKDSLAASVLDELSITETAVRASQQEATVESRVPDSTDYMSAKLVAVLERAALEAKQLQHDYLGTEHLLLALLAVPDTNAEAILQKLNLQAETARARILQRIESGKQA